MQRIVKTMYRTRDGHTFEDRNHALRWERALLVSQRVAKYHQTGRFGPEELQEALADPEVLQYVMEVLSGRHDFEEEAQS